MLPAARAPGAWGRACRGLPAAAGAAAPAWRLFSSSSDAPEAQDLYSVLGVKSTASRQELKQAFRTKAKLLHPDASPHAEASSQFVELVHAYQVLAHPRSRQLYDLARDRSGPGVLRAAAASGVSGATYEEVQVDLSWGLGRLFQQPPAGSSAALDQVRQELQTELHSALRKAYLGPKLEGLSVGCLPDAFEADERAELDCPDLLQLVSGRQKLGSVRERRLAQLARQAAAAAALREGEGRKEGAAAALPHAAVHAGQAPEEQQRGAGERSQGVPPDCMHSSSEEQQRQQANGSSSSGRQRPLRQRDPDVLDLFLGEDLVASAVRHFPKPFCDSTGSDASGGSSSESGSSSEGGGGSMEAPTPAEVIRIFDGEGQLLAQVEAQQLDPGSATASSARLLSARGTHTHTVYRTQSPLVRHLTFTAEPAGTGVSARRPSRLVVCRARRAWLPPSSLWLFRPLSYEHDIGGWCLEWAGKEQEGHPAWLHPAVFVLTAAFDSLDHERASRQPMGLFGRLRSAAATEAASAAGQGTEGAARWRSWLGSALRFHGRGR